MSYISIDYNANSYPNMEAYEDDFMRLNSLAMKDASDTFHMTTLTGVEVTYDGNVFRVDRHQGYFRVYYEISMEVANELTAMRMMRKVA